MKKTQQSQSAQQFLKPNPQVVPPSPNASYINATQFVTYVAEPRFDPHDFVQGNTTIRDVLLYKEIFDFLDFNKNGVLQPMDLRRAFQDVGGYRPKKQLIYQMLSDFDNDESGIIEFREFIKMMTMRPCDLDSKEDIERVFSNIDQDLNGYLTIDDLKYLAEECQEEGELTDEQLNFIIRQCDPEGDGKIRYDAFLKFMKKSQYH